MRAQLFEEQFVERVDQVALAVQIEAEGSQIQLVEGDVRADRRVPPGTPPWRSGARDGGSSRSGVLHCAAETVTGQSVAG